MKRAKHEGRHVSLVRDKLYIEGELYVLPDNRREQMETASSPNPQPSLPQTPSMNENVRQVNKRQRIGSSPNPNIAQEGRGGQFATNYLNLSDSQQVLSDTTRIDYVIVHPNVNLNVNNNDSVNTINCTLNSDCSNFEKNSRMQFCRFFFRRYKISLVIQQEMSDLTLSRDFHKCRALRERPFNLKGAVCFFSKKIF